MKFRNTFFIAYGATLLAIAVLVLDVDLVLSILLFGLILKLIAGGISLLTDRVYTEQRSLHGGNYVLVGVDKMVPDIINTNRLNNPSNAASNILKRFT